MVPPVQVVTLPLVQVGRWYEYRDIGISPFDLIPVLTPYPIIASDIVRRGKLQPFYNRVTGEGGISGQKAQRHFAKAGTVAHNQGGFTRMMFVKVRKGDITAAPIII